MCKKNLTTKLVHEVKGNEFYYVFELSRLNTLRCQLGVRLLFINEISMVSNSMFNIQIDDRLKDIKQSHLPFGTVSIIATGDLFQLQPLIDGYILRCLDNLEYSILAPTLAN